MTNSIREKWDKIYSKNREQIASPVAVVRENLHLLPQSGIGLELACGMAANSFAMAEHGIKMEAWDISPIAVEQVNQRAIAEDANVLAAVRDVVEQPPEYSHYDLVVVSHFLDRSIITSIIDCLKPGGVVLYQTFSQARVGDGGPSNMDFRLADNELLSLFADFKILAYREEGTQGDTSKGFRNEAMLVAQKPLV